MKIAVDARMRFHTGVGTYLRGLFPELLRQMPEHEWFVLQPGDGKWELPAATLLPCLTPPLSAAEHLVVPRLLRRRAIDWLLVPHFNAPYDWPAEKTLAVVHDTIPLLFPAPRKPWVAPVFRYLTERLLRRAPLVLTDSQATAIELRKMSGREVPVVYPGLLPLPTAPAAAADEVPAERYLFVLGGKAHKDAALAVKIFTQLAAPGVRLVLRQTPGEDGGATAAAVQASPLRERITVIDRRVPEARLAALYAGAAAFIYCSKAEGFGYPPLEAMQHGVPVVARRAGALPEVLGEAALWFAGDDVAGAAGQVRRLLGEATLRQQQIARGQTQSARYAWPAAAAQVAAHIRAAVA